MKRTKAQLQTVARKVRDGHGIELTPAQVQIELDNAYATIRREMVRAGHSEFAGMSDEEIYKMLKETRQ